MKNEVINSFSEGLVTDLNELNTSAKVMTDALNATLLTFNGNEFSLQNDMGNARVGTSYLPKGYVPVGVKEHGGIIYVASHNPSTGKGQIGCFPSPQQLWGTDEADFEPFSIDLNRILSKEGNILYIDNDFYRSELFIDDITKTARELHPGDEFLITANLSDYINLIAEGVLVLKLASVGKDGVVNYINEKDLRLYTHGDGVQINSWIAPEGETVRQVFPGQTSGKLMIVVEYNVYDSFDLNWSYNVSSNEVKSVTFEGKATGNFTTKLLYDLNNSISSEAVTLPVRDDSLTYKIAPYSYYGIQKKLIKEGTIALNELLANQDGILDSWSYFVGQNKVEIYWGFNYLDLNGKSIDKMRFVFIPITAISDSIDFNTALNSSWYVEEIEKSSYLGSFEDTFNFNDSSFKKDYIYICRIDKCIEGNWTKVGFEYIYTTPLFNGVTASQIKAYKNKRPIVKISLNPSVTQEKHSSEDHYLKTKSDRLTTNALLDDQDLESNDNLSPLFVQNPVSNTTYKFLSAVQRTGNITIKSELKAEETIDFDGINYSRTFIVGDLTNIPNLSISGTSIKRKSLYLNDKNTSQLDNIQETARSLGNNTINYNIYRTIYASNGQEVTKDIPYERLRPAYESEEDITNLFSFKYDSNGHLLCVGAEDEDIRYNTKITGVKETTESDKGIALVKSDANISPDNDLFEAALDSMRSGSPGTVGILAGISSNVGNSDDARLKFYDGIGMYLGVSTNFFNFDNWGSVNGEDYDLVDAGENYLIASWKATNGSDYLINLMSQKTERGIYRTDSLLKTILSQLLVVKYKKESLRYLAPDSNAFNYHLPHESEIELSFEQVKENPTFELDGKSLKELYDKWDKYADNYLPSFIYSIPSEIKSSIYVGKDLEVNESLINLYLNSYNLGDNLLIKPSPTDTPESTTEWRKTIHVAKVSSITSSGICVLEQNSEGNYIRTGDNGKLQFSLNGNLTKVNLGLDINDCFKTRVAHEGIVTSIPEGWYNEILLDVDKLESYKWYGKWAYGTQTEAPDFYSQPYFGEMSKFGI